ncbi:spore germination protein GerPC [Bacillus tianshenii]|nr:spore germination protein GerPC [Bacillus tianshenii]MCA1319169.1 spore germination protein GerPC [Bacillus tianshenii]
MILMNEEKSVENKLKELEQKLDILEGRIAELTKERAIHYHIQHLDIREATFDQLHYHLDSISIESLSGTLNIGNNFDGGSQGKLQPTLPDNQKQKPTSFPEKIKGRDETNSNGRNGNVKSHSDQKERPQKDLIVTPKTKGYSVTFTKKEENQ